jgi:hypothetical protein
LRGPPGVIAAQSLRVSYVSPCDASSQRHFSAFALLF